MKLLLQRAVPKGPSAVRRIALSAATKQRLTLCTALLAEVSHQASQRKMPGSVRYPLYVWRFDR